MANDATKEKKRLKMMKKLDRQRKKMGLIKEKKEKRELQ